MKPGVTEAFKGPLFGFIQTDIVALISPKPSTVKACKYPPFSIFQSILGGFSKQSRQLLGKALEQNL